MTGLPSRGAGAAKRVARRIPGIERVRDRFIQEWRFFRSASPMMLVNPRKLLLLTRVRRHSMLDYARLSALYDLARDVRARGVEGTFVECGSYNGGSGAVLAWMAAPDRNRTVWLFDSWEGMPEAGLDDVSVHGSRGRKGIALGAQAAVERLLFNALGLDRDRICLVAGWFQETLEPRLAELRPIALLHLDADWYESIRFCLETLYDSVSSGGVIAIDDYAYWQGCRRAVDEFVTRRQLAVYLHHVGIAVWFTKP